MEKWPPMDEQCQRSEAGEFALESSFRVDFAPRCGFERDKEEGNGVEWSHLRG